MDGGQHARASSSKPWHTSVARHTRLTSSPWMSAVAPAEVRDWRTFLAAEPVERFAGFGQPILAPANGRVVAMHDGEPDLTARRSPIVAVPYLLTQGHGFVGVSRRWWVTTSSWS